MVTCPYIFCVLLFTNNNIKVVIQMHAFLFDPHFSMRINKVSFLCTEKSYLTFRIKFQNQLCLSLSLFDSLSLSIFISISLFFYFSISLFLSLFFSTPLSLSLFLTLSLTLALFANNCNATLYHVYFSILFLTFFFIVYYVHHITIMYILTLCY